MLFRSRPPGAPLWPEWEGLDRLRKRRLEVGERVWAASYQQSPVPPEGALFAADRLFVDDGNVGPDPIAVRAWDFAATTIAESRDPDWTVGIKLCRPTPDRFVILDVVRLRGTPLQVQHTLVATARADGKNVRIDLPQDPGSAGKILSRQYTGLLSGYRVK